METKNIILELRTKKGLSQEELAEKVFVTRQAVSHEKDGIFNEDYCKWCSDDGEYMYHDMDDLIEVCVANMASEAFPSEQARAYLKEMLPRLDY